MISIKNDKGDMTPEPHMLVALETRRGHQNSWELELQAAVKALAAVLGTKFRPFGSVSALYRRPISPAPRRDISKGLALGNRSHPPSVRMSNQEEDDMIRTDLW